MPLADDTATLFSDEALETHRDVAEQLLFMAPDEFYVSGNISSEVYRDIVDGVLLLDADFLGALHRGPHDFIHFGNPNQAETWRQHTIDAFETSADHTELRLEYFGGDTYSPVLTGPGLHTPDAFDSSLWSDFHDQITDNPKGLFDYYRPERTLGSRYEKIVTVPGFNSSAMISLATGSRGATRTIWLFAGDQVSSGDLDAAAVALQTFLEDGLTTLQADHPDNFDEYFGYTTVPIVDAG